MDAAVDNMKNYGFEEKLIKSTVKELLKVYMMCISCFLGEIVLICCEILCVFECSAV